MLAPGRRRRGRTPPAAAASAQLLVEPVDELGHLLELVGDRADPVLAEMLRLDAEGLCEPSSTSFEGTGLLPWTMWLR